ncbi:hypothetical protein [Microbacterium sp. YJN-G]|uniref:hypothetical protein n=1 Tax=Microbacterium sp. YJN-G TaxID=2763257 RepID=UPI00187774A4|nr:hypothetical protein [Microbacterium sp. YJN-G]
MSKDPDEIADCVCTDIIEPIGPDCRAGKHDACDGRALDETADEVTDCMCSCHRKHTGITLPNGTTSDEVLVARFLNSSAHWQIVTDGPAATCPTCGYPERHRIYDVGVEDATLLADGCPACETSRMDGGEDG